MKKKVMIIDDDKNFLESLKDTLLLSGYDVVAASDSSLAIKEAIREKPDVILLDIKMPEKSGFQLAHELQNSQEVMDIPIIAMTAYFKEGNVPFMDTCGFQACIKKPFNPLDAIAHIEAVLKE